MVVVAAVVSVDLIAITFWGLSHRRIQTVHVVATVTVITEEQLVLVEYRVGGEEERETSLLKANVWALPTPPPLLPQTDLPGCPFPEPI